MNSRQKDNLTDVVEDTRKPQATPQDSRPQDKPQQVVNNEGERITLGNQGGSNRAV